MYGDNCGLERRIAIQMVAAWQAMGRTALVLNDGTRGDLILEREDGRFLVVQLKTTHGKAIGHTDYEFQHVHGYTRMPVVCWCEAEEIGWVADGTALDARTTRKKIRPEMVRDVRGSPRPNGARGACVVLFLKPETRRARVVCHAERRRGIKMTSRRSGVVGCGLVCGTHQEARGRFRVVP